MTLILTAAEFSNHLFNASLDIQVVFSFYYEHCYNEHFGSCVHSTNICPASL